MDAEFKPGPDDLLRAAFTDFLNREAFQWDSFCTFTFERARSRRSIDSCSNMLRDMQSERGRPIRAFIAEEIGRMGGRRHLHALIEHPGWTGFQIGARWERRPGGGFATIREFIPSRGAQSYVTKYIIKDANNLGDWDLVTYGEIGPDFLWSDNGLTLAQYQLYSLTCKTLAARGQNQWVSSLKYLEGL